MPWFNVDDGFHSHPKALATSLAARGLWVTAGSWSSAHLTDGVVPDYVLASLGGSPELAAELVAAGLWSRMRGAHVFHDWTEWGNDPRDAVLRKRAQAAERQRRFRSSHAASNGVSHAPVTRDKRVSHSSQSNPVSELDVSDQVGVSDRASVSDDVTETIIKAIYERTSRVISPDWAAKIAANILGRAGHVRSQAAYCARAIAAEPDPAARFLPAYPETP